MTRFDILIVGSGHAGAQAAIILRQLGFAGSIGLVGEEPLLPYERPPLSKDYLLGEKSFERMLLRPERFWVEHDIALLPGRRVIAVRPEEKRVSLADGGSLDYGRLIWAAGGTPRMLACPGGDGPGVRTIRTRHDVDAILERLDRTERVAIVGGGYIGLEAASALARLGKAVTVIEALDRVLARVAGPEISAYFEEKHRAEGVDVRTGIQIESIEEEESGHCLVLAGGDRVAADMVIVGIGIVPATSPLILAGAAGADGVDVDEYCRTSLADVYAIGDCAAHCNRFAGGRRIRVESVQNAHDLARTAAQHVVGDPKPYDAVPWFWSNQFDVKLQTVGLSIGYDRTEVRGDPASGSFSVVYEREGRVIALDCVNSVKAYVQGRALVMAGATAP